MMVSQPEKLYTANEFLKVSRLLHLYNGKRMELIEGKILRMSPASEEHGEIVSELNMLIRQHVKLHNLGRVTVETGYVVSHEEDGKDTVLAPNIAYTSQRKIPTLPSSGFANYAPDLAIEVVSSEVRAMELQRKVMKYLDNGTLVVWLVYPEIKSVEIYTSAGSIRVQSHQRLSGGSVLPGFMVRVREIFPR